MADNTNTLVLVAGVAIIGYIVLKNTTAGTATTGPRTPTNPNGLPPYQTSATGSTATPPTNGSVLQNANTSVKELTNLVTTGKDLWGTIFPPSTPITLDPITPITVGIKLP